jgi:hypothetical protein
LTGTGDADLIERYADLGVVYATVVTTAEALDGTASGHRQPPPHHTAALT